MKYFGGIAFLLGSLIGANCVHFEVQSKLTGGACILLDVDATFNLTYTNENQTEDAPLFNLKGATVEQDSSHCGNVLLGTTSVLSVRIFPSRELLMFTFLRQPNSQYMSVRFTLDAKKHFKNMTDTNPVVLNDEKNIPLGHDTPNSYLCRTKESVKFSPNNNFMMTMMLEKLQVQAYRIRNSEFGPAIECSQDFATSTPEPETTVNPHNETTTPSKPETTTDINSNMTTEPQPETTTRPHSNATTEPNPTMSTEPHSNITTEPLPETTTQPQTETTAGTHSETTSTPKVETTTSMSPTTSEIPHIPKYVVRDNGEVCIVLQGNITFEIPYQKKDGNTGTADVALPDNVIVNGNCSYTDTEQQITLVFFNSTWVLDIVIAKAKQSVLQSSALFKALSETSDYSWQSVSLKYVVDKHFPNANNPGAKITAVADGTVGKFKANTDGSYKCNAQQDLEFGKNKMKMDLNSMQYRAFGNTNSTDFSNSGVFECPADNSNTDNGSNHKTLGIALGCAFAGLVVIVFVACGITRYRKRKQNEMSYESIN